jgi:KaiC/GvpD/RAD55 family RecA-like ATPase
MLIRAILPQWRETSGLPKVVEGDFDEDKIKDLNENGAYNIYFLPNYPSQYDPSQTVDGTHIDTFQYVFADMDLKEGHYDREADFLTVLEQFPLQPTTVVLSGNGVHAYWEVQDLDAMSFLRLQRRLCRHLRTDEAVAKIYQLMRVPGTLNNKKATPKKCEIVKTTGAKYSCEQLSKALPPISQQDEAYCKAHYDKTYGLSKEVQVKEELPAKFMRLLKNSNEVRELYAGTSGDRSRSDFRLAHLLFADGFSKDEAMSVLVNCDKASSRAPVHRVNYAKDIVDKIWIFENNFGAPAGSLSSSVKDILRKGDSVKGTKFPCWSVFDGTYNGFRLSQVLGLIGGAGSGKTTVALNYFYWFVKLNPEYIHVFVSLEQPEEEIALRWAKICGENETMHDRVHVLGNYNSDGSYRNLSLTEIEDYIKQLEKDLKVKVGCVVIDHVGVLKKKGRENESQNLIDIFHGMKSFAKHTNTFLIMQSQTSREKAGNGDLELDKDAAYGSTLFEWYADYIVTSHQPLKRVYAQAPHMTVTAFKVCKIRHKNVHKDRMKEDTLYALMFDPETERLREMTVEEEESYEFFNKQATALRNKDRKREPSRITKIDWSQNETD